MFYWIMKHLVAGPLVKGIFRPWVTGLENIPQHGGVILASNHLSFIDSIILPLIVDRRVSFLAKSEYFTQKGIKGWPSTVPAARRRRTRSTPGSECSRAATCSGSTPRAREARTASSTGVARESRG
jgi:1-acyl-sn-glycerol-3-phosphate acyltransferase